MVLQDHLLVINRKEKKDMEEIKLENTKMIIGGGVGFTGAVISAIKGYINTVFEMGQMFGGAIRRISRGNLCKF